MFSKLRIFWVWKTCHQVSFGELQLTQISLNFKTSCWNFKTRCPGAKLCVWLSYYFNFERSYDVLNSKNPFVLLNKNINFNKKETKSKIRQAFLERQTLCFSSCKNRNLKMKLWWFRAHERKKRLFFVPFILSERNFLRFCFNKLYSVLNTLSEYTYFYISKILLHTLLLLVSKIVESLQCILKATYLEQDPGYNTR